MGIKLYPNQLDAKRRMHNGSILRGGVGSGKSPTALSYFYDVVCGGYDESVPGAGDADHADHRGLRTPRDIYIVTTKKKRDDLEWEGEAAKFGISPSREASVSGIQLLVDSWNNIQKYTGVQDAFFIFDEQRLVGSGAWVKAFLKIAKANEWIMLTATPGDSWIEYAPIFIANGFYKNRTEFLDHHVVYDRFSKYPKIKKYLGTDRLAAYRDRVLVEMPDERHTVRHLTAVTVDHDHESFQRAVKDRWHVLENRPIRDAGELFILMRRIVNSDPARLSKLKTILSKHSRLIVFYNFNYELEMLRKFCSENSVAVAEWNGHRHQPIPTGTEWIYLVQYTAGAEGWNCISTNAMVFYSLNYSYKIFEQAQGRIDRINTPFTDLYYYIFKSDSLIDKMITKALRKKETFNERKAIQAHFQSMGS